jgi:AcrR family transcriptional regulator
VNTPTPAKASGPAKKPTLPKADPRPGEPGRPKKAGSGSAGGAALGPEGSLDTGGAPASRRALRNQGRRTMRKLLDAAMVAFDRRGYHATRVNDVVEIAKTSHGTFYLYFSNKEDLLRALMSEAATESQALYAALVDAPETGASWEQLRAWIGRYSSLWCRYAPLLRAWTDLAAIDPELGVQIRQTVTAISSALAARISSAPGNSEIAPEAAGMAVLAMLDRFHYLREFVGQPVDEAGLDTLTTIVHRALFEGVITA